MMGENKIQIETQYNITRIWPPELMIETTIKDNTAMGDIVSRTVVDMENEALKRALVALGWKPPPSREVSND